MEKQIKNPPGFTKQCDGEPTYELAYFVTAVDRGEVTAHKLFVWDAETRGFVEAPFSEVPA